jgi:N-methylhydantoinase B
MKLMSRGVIDESFIRLLRTNSRTPDVVIGDLRAQIAALAVGERRVAEVISQHGVDEFETAQEELVDYAKRRALVVQKLIPDGEYSFWDYLDDDYRSGIPVRLRCRMKVDNGRINMDLEGSDPQLAAPYNVPTGGNRHPYLTTKILHLLASYDRDLPLNSGLFENISVSVPLGSVMNPEFPAPVGIRHATAIRFADVVLGCLSQAAPEMVPAASGGAVIPVVVSQVDRAGGRRSVAVIQALAGGAGATARMEGADGRDRSLANIRNTPTESGEADVGVRVEQYSLRPDSGGPGQFRGGAGIIYSIRVLRDGTQILGRGLERFVFRPWGANGGQPGQSARVILNIGSREQQELGKIDVVRAREGDLLTIMTPGGGGYGDPFSRDSRLVQQDVRYGLVTAAAARVDFGVALDPVTLAIDETATADIRAHRASSATGFGFDPIRTSWESLFDDLSMTALADALLKIPAGFRSEERLALFEKVLPGVGKRGAMAVLDHDFNIDRARIRLASEIRELGVRWRHPS